MFHPSVPAPNFKRPLPRGYAGRYVMGQHMPSHWQSGAEQLPAWALVISFLIETEWTLHTAFADWRSRSFKRQPLVHAAVGGRWKRFLDVIVAGIALLLLLPVLVTVAIWLKLTQGGSVVFSHQRVGQAGRMFPCFKFRTMVIDGDTVLADYLEANPTEAQQWREFRKLSHDPRVTKFGRFLRKTSLDELPQLINVLRGEMSCVGPRPIVSAELEHYGVDAPAYLSARPGVTGVWQVSGRNRLGYDARVAFDVYYVTHWSIWLDFWIMLNTIPAVLRTGDTA